MTTLIIILLLCLSASFVHAAASTSTTNAKVSTAPVNTVQISTATGQRIQFDGITGIAHITGDGKIVTSTGTLTADDIRVDTRRRTGHAVGHVHVVQSSGTITGTEADYNWVSSTAVIKNASGDSPPYKFTADEVDQVSPDRLHLRSGYFTTCDLDPPHYRMESSDADVRLHDRVTMQNARLVADDLPVLWMPWYTHSLVPKKYTLRIQPGTSSRDGFTNRTTFGYPFTPNSYTTIRWDYLQNTGNGLGLEQRYFSPNVRGMFQGYYIHDSNPDPTPTSTDYSVLWNHYQKFSSRLTGNARFELRNPQDLGSQVAGVGSGVLVENPVRGVLSEGGLNYQFPRASLQLLANRQDKYDTTVSSKSFISQLTLPQLSYTTIPLSWKRFPVLTNFAASFMNQTVDRSDPTQSLTYIRTGSASVQFRKDLRLGRKWTFTPLAGYAQSWQNRDITLSSATFDDVYIGRYSTGADARRKIGRDIDLTLGYRWTGRTDRNRLAIDSDSDDHGVETNQVNSSIVDRIGRDTRLSLTDTLDLRRAPVSLPEKYDHFNERIQPITMDLQTQMTKDIAVNFREVYSVFETTQSVRTPINTAGEIQFGNPAGVTFFSQGFTYTKLQGDGLDSQVLLTSKLRFYLTRKWYLDGAISYSALGDRGINYGRIKGIDKSITVVRDLHCWVFRMEFLQRPDRTDASFYIDLKSNMGKQKSVFTPANDVSAYGDQGKDHADPAIIFPDTDAAVAPPAVPAAAPLPTSPSTDAPKP